MNYKKVDFSTWPRGDLFQFYMDHMRVVMSLTVDMDVTPLVRFVKQRGMKFYPAMIWVVSRVINVHEAVSYTHLDVYKRQGLTSYRRIVARCRGCATRTYLKDGMFIQELHIPAA